MFYWESLYRRLPLVQKKYPLCGVLMYHSVVDNDSSLPYPYSIHKSTFMDHVEFLSGIGKCVSLDTFVEHINSGLDFCEPTFAITLDDGYRNNITNALSVAKSFGVPITVFITTSLIDSGMSSFCGWPMLRRQGGGKFLNLESHAVNHVNMTSLDQEDIFYQASRSRDIIESKLSASVSYFAYPSGGFNCDIEEAVKEAGYNKAFKDRNPFDMSSFTIGRFGVGKKHQRVSDLLYGMIRQYISYYL
jgi:peptidoglycan/xylan/chitin deacetylase (PgdA/CDA1 family)